MVNPTRKLTYLSAALDELIALRPECHGHDRALVNELIASMTEFQRSFGAGAEPHENQAAGQPEPAQQAPPPAGGKLNRGPYHGMGLGEAAVEYLRIKGEIQTPREIWAALYTGGVTTAHKDPVSAVRNVLGRREKRQGDVILVGEGKWGLDIWITDEEREQIARQMGGMGARDHEAHSASTKEGMKNAMARGVRLGQPPKLNAKKVACFKRLIASGSSIRDACAAIRVSVALYYNHRAEIDAWNEGDPWPPSKSTNDGDGGEGGDSENDSSQGSPNLRLVGD